MYLPIFKGVNAVQCLSPNSSKTPVIFPRCTTENLWLELDLALTCLLLLRFIFEGVGMGVSLVAVVVGYSTFARVHNYVSKFYSTVHKLEWHKCQPNIHPAIHSTSTSNTCIGLEMYFELQTIVLVLHNFVLNEYTIQSLVKWISVLFGIPCLIKLWFCLLRSKRLLWNRICLAWFS